MQAVEAALKRGFNPFNTQQYFTLLENTVKELELESTPFSIWSLDESSFCTDPSKIKLIGDKNLPYTRAIITPGRNNITVLLAASALGEKISSLIIFKGKNFWNEWFAPIEYLISWNHICRNCQRLDGIN